MGQLGKIEAAIKKTGAKVYAISNEKSVDLQKMKDGEKLGETFVFLSDQEAKAPEPVADEVIVDGRLSGLPPRYDDDDPSSAEAEIQQKDDGEGPALGSPEGDGDFASDNREPDSTETDAGESKPEAKPEEPSGLEKIIDAISHGTLLP